MTIKELEKLNAGEHVMVHTADDEYRLAVFHKLTKVVRYKHITLEQLMSPTFSVDKMKSRNCTVAVVSYVRDMFDDGTTERVYVIPSRLRSRCGWYV